MLRILDTVNVTSYMMGTVCIHFMLSSEDLEEVLGDEDVSSAGLEQDDLAFIPPPEWPDSSEEENTTPLAG